MKVTELIELLQRFPQDAFVDVYSDAGIAGITIDVDNEMIPVNVKSEELLWLK